MKKILTNILLWLGICSIVTFGWQTAELIIYGQIEIRQVDSILGFILTMSLYCNFKTLMNGNMKKRKVLTSHEIAIVTMHLNNLVCQLQKIVDDDTIETDHWTTKHDIVCLQRGILYLENNYYESEK